MKVYLAGKIDDVHGAWRNDLIAKRVNMDLKKNVPGWVYFTPERRVGFSDNPNQWPDSGWSKVLDKFDYTGPYRHEVISDDKDWSNLGVYHGTEWAGSHGEIYDEGAKRFITRSCLKAIVESDVVFAYLNHPDCFGTLVELGYATAFRKYIALVIHYTDAKWEWSDYWFVENLAHYTALVGRPVYSYGSDTVIPPETVDIAREFERAIVDWASIERKPEQPSGSSPAPSGLAPIQESALAFASIVRWTSDPRVRDEAQRMLKRLKSGVAI